MHLRHAAVGGGAFVIARELAGVLIRLAGMLVLTRFIGPEAFGQYIAAAAVVAVLATVAQMGAEVYLVRQAAQPDDRTYDAVFTVLLAAALATTGMALLASVAVSLVVEGSEVLDAFQVLALTIPVNVLWAPAQARLERAFRFDSMAVIEVGGDVVLYAVSVGLAIAGAGVWAPVAGYVAWQSWLFVASLVLAGHRPRLCWDGGEARRVLRYGARYTPAMLLGRAELLVNPVVVGAALGASAVGQVALAVRIVESLSFVARATWRVSIVTLGRVQDDLHRLRRGFEQGMTLQVLAFAPVLAAFGLVAEWAVPALFGDSWGPAARLFPYLALAALLAAVLNLHTSLLYVRGMNGVVLGAAAARLAATGLAAGVLVPAIGLTGYGLAALLVVSAFPVARRGVLRILPFRYGLVWLWVAAFTPAVFAPLLPAGLLPAAVVVPVLVAATPAARRQLAATGRLVGESVRARLRDGRVEVSG